MDETTTTDTSSETVESGLEPQLDTTGDTSAEVETSETHTDPGTNASSTQEDDNVAWLRNKGIDPTDPDALRKAASLYRETERQFHTTRQQTKSMEQTVADQEAEAGLDQFHANPETLRLQRQMSELQFFLDNPEAKTMQQEIVEQGKLYPELAQSFNLNALYALARANKSEAEIKAAESRGRQAAKAEIARAGAAAIPSAPAAGETPATPALTRESIAAMSKSEYVERREEIKAAISSGKLQ